MSGPRVVRAPRGPQLRTRGWLQEAALRCLMNNLDPEVAERPDDLVVYGGRGKAARTWEAFDAIVRSLESLGDDETLLVQSGKPVGVFPTHPMAPRVLIANSLLVPDWADWEHFWDLEAAGLTMYGQMTAGSWIYIGTQGILQGTFQTFAAVAERRFGGSLKGTLTLTAGLGGMGGAQPLAVTMNEGVALDRGGGPGPHPPPPGDPLPGHHGGQPRRGGGPGPGGQGGGSGPVGGRRGQRRRGLPGIAAPGGGDRHRHRPDLGARPPQRLRPGGVLAGGGGRPAGEGPRRLRRRGPRLHGPSLCRHGRLPAGRGRGLRLRQQPAG